MKTTIRTLWNSLPVVWLGTLLAAQARGANFDLLATVPLPTNAESHVAVSEVRNKVYASGGASSGEDVVVIDGITFATTNVGSGSGGNVDDKSDRYWAATVFGASVIVRNGATNSVVATVPLSDCPIGATYDFYNNRVWASAQCGGGNDHIFRLHTST